MSSSINVNVNTFITDNTNSITVPNERNDNMLFTKQIIKLRIGRKYLKTPPK